MEQELTATTMSVENTQNTLWTIRNIHIQDWVLRWPYKYSPFSILCFQIRTRFELHYQGCHTTRIMCFDQQQPKFTAVYIGISRHAGLLLSSHKRALELHSPEYGFWHLKSDLWITVIPRLLLDAAMEGSMLSHIQQGNSPICHKWVSLPCDSTGPEDLSNIRRISLSERERRSFQQPQFIVKWCY